MNVPGFSAVDSLRKSTQNYPRSSGGSGVPASAAVLGQLRSLGSQTGAMSVGRRIGGPRTGFTCSGFACTCRGDQDCNDMYSTGLCGDVGVCDENGCWCLRI